MDVLCVGGVDRMQAYDDCFAEKAKATDGAEFTSSTEYWRKLRPCVEQKLRDE